MRESGQRLGCSPGALSTGSRLPQALNSKRFMGSAKAEPSGKAGRAPGGADGQGPLRILSRTLGGEHSGKDRGSGRPQVPAEQTRVTWKPSRGPCRAVTRFAG